MKIPGFDIKRTIGKGGMATVYLATQTSLRRAVALKTLTLRDSEDDAEDAATQYGESISSEERFIDEGRIVASLDHPNVIRIHDVGATPTVMYISMEYLRGGDLRVRLMRPFEIDEVLAILIRIGMALECAHEGGVVHRDVKPANILFRQDGSPVLSDFGIAKNLFSDAHLTTTGRVIGSPFYLSPEQAEGGDIDGRADIYSLGVILFEMLTGDPPYAGTSAMKVLIQHMQAPVPTLPEERRRFQPLLERMMAKDPDARFETAGDLVRHARALRQQLAGGSVEVRGETRDPPAPARVRGHVDAAMAEVIERFRNGILEDLANDRIVLPSLPDIVLEVRRTLEEPRANSSRIAAVIAADPALSAQVLRVANSAFYAGAGPVRDLPRAVTRLGTGIVQQVVMMLVVAQLYNVAARPRVKPHLEELWRHSTLVAALSQGLARRVPGLGADTAMLAGLIHDIGALPVLVWADQIPHIIANRHSLYPIIENLHAELGGAILRKWRYPPELIAVAALHEELDREHDAGPDYTDLVIVANVLARQGEPHPLGGVEASRLPAFGRLGLAAGSVEALVEAARGEAAALSEVLRGGG